MITRACIRICIRDKSVKALESCDALTNDRLGSSTFHVDNKNRSIFKYNFSMILLWILDLL